VYKIEKLKKAAKIQQQRTVEPGRDRDTSFFRFSVNESTGIA
jgi:hypothetical protein